MITVHGRLSKEAYSSPSRWDEIARSVRLRDSISPDTLILGNGDVKDINQASEYVKKYGVDGVMIGRAILNNPWLFSGRKPEDISKEERFEVLKKHLEIFEKERGDMDIFNSQKKYIKAYISNFDTAADMRIQLMTADSTSQVMQLLASFNKMTS
jgi:tRNA-dihydrouridine synthase